MKLICGLTIVSAILAAGAAAQDDPAQAKLQVEKMMANAVIRLDGGVMGPAVKGAPYSADEIRETNETLADGTRIHNESKVTVYRDSEGRVRRETPDQISIWDPAAGTNYVLDPKTMTARKMMLHFVYSKTGEGLPNQNVTFTYRTMGGTLADAGGGTIRVGGTEGGAIAVAQAKVDADAKAAAMLDADKAAAAGFGVGTKVVRRLNAGAKEALGTQVMEGVSAEGERTTSTIEVGAIGNDRPIQTIFERWYSPDLQTNVMTRRSDPRTGEEIFRLSNVHRGEPSPVLFEVPASYTIVGNK